MTVDCPHCGYEDVSFRATVSFHQSDGKLTNAEPIDDAEIYCRDCKQNFIPGDALPFPEIKVEAEICQNNK